MTRIGRAMLAVAVAATTAPLAAAPFTTNTGPTQPAQQAPNYGAPSYGTPAYGAPAYTNARTAAPMQQRYTAAPPYGQPQQGQAQQGLPQVQYGQPRMAYQMPTAASQDLPASGGAVTPAPGYDPAPATHSYQPMESYTQPAPPVTGAPAAGGDCNCNTGAPAATWEGYTAGGDCGCTGDYGSCGAYECADSGCYTGAACGPRRQWFVGVYGLYMSRDRPYTIQTSVLTTGAPPSYYPMPTDTYVTNNSADVGFAAGAEIRFGSTFGAACDPCGCGTSQPFAWEVGYWALDDDSSSSVIIDSLGGPARMYGRINYSGLNYDRDGAGGTYTDRRLNDYSDYQPFPNPTPNEIRVLANRVRQSFSAQNLELNFWRFGTTPTVGNSCGYAASACSTTACGGYDACGGCDTSCAPTACGCSAPAQRFFFSGLAGVRFVQFDEYFQNGYYFTADTDDDGTPDAGEPSSYPGGFPPSDTNSFFHDIDVDNDLVGFQLGCSMNCLVGCRWTLFADTNFGIYGNDADVYQRVYSPGGGTITYANGGGTVASRTSKQDVAFMGEARLGVGYQMSCKWRATAAWRVLGVSGVALAGDQIPDAGWNNSQSVGYIHSNGSLILHGLQAGVECKY